jgi:hypothetical protein
VTGPAYPRPVRSGALLFDIGICPIQGSLWLNEFGELRDP